MPPAAKKDCSIILFDLNSNNQAKQALLKISSFNFLCASKNLTKLILLNSEESLNCFHLRDNNNYKHIKETDGEVNLYNPKLLLESVEKSNVNNSANWLEGMHVALQNLEDEYENINGIVTYQLLFFTNFDCDAPTNNSRILLKKIIDLINKLNAFVYVIGPNVQPPFLIKSQNDIKTWMQNLEVDGDQSNLIILSDIIYQTRHTVVCDYKAAIHLFFAYKNAKGSQPWKVPISIGSKIAIPSQTCKAIRDEPKFKVRRRQKLSQPLTYVYVNDETVECPMDETIAGVQRHGKFVPMPDKKMFKLETSRSLHVLCFTDKANVPEWLMRGGGCYHVLPSTPEKNEAFDILIDTLASQNKCAIARRVYNNGYSPKIVVLVPKPDYEPKCFLLTQLPFADNVVLELKEKNPKSAPKDEIVSEIKTSLQNLTVDQSDGSNLGDLAVGITMMVNPHYNNIINTFIDKLCDKYMQLNEVDIDLLRGNRSVDDGNFDKIWPDRDAFADIGKKKATEDEGNASDSDFEW